MTTSASVALATMALARSTFCASGLASAACTRWLRSVEALDASSDPTRSLSLATSRLSSATNRRRRPEQHHPASHAPDAGRGR
jgi:hypothetical protein